MNREAYDTIAKNYQDAFEEVDRQMRSSCYVTKKTVEQEKTADTEEWEPSGYIREAVPNFDSIRIELITKETDLNKVNRTLRESETVGLVVMGETVHRSSKPASIIMVTDKVFYVIRPDDIDRGIQMLRMKLMDKELNFWTTNGLNEADCLLHNYKINLAETGATCCTGVHIHLMQTLKYWPDSAVEKYPILAVRRSKSNIRIESFETLVELWLDIPKEDIHCDEKKLSHLRSNPLNLTAINLIKRRCVLVIPLAKKLEYYSWLEVHSMSQNTFARLTCCDERIREDTINGIRRIEEDNVFDIASIAHLDNIFASDEGN